MPRHSMPGQSTPWCNMLMWDKGSTRPLTKYRTGNCLC
jgi:hypothetical protein